MANSGHHFFLEFIRKARAHFTDELLYSLILYQRVGRGYRNTVMLKDHNLPDESKFGDDKRGEKRQELFACQKLYC